MAVRTTKAAARKYQPTTTATKYQPIHDRGVSKYTQENTCSEVSF